MKKILLTACFIIGLISVFVACRKQSILTEDSYVQNQRFFIRYNTSTPIDDGHHIQNQDLIDTIIAQLKEADINSKFANQIVKQFGYPDWNSSLSLKNENGFKSIFIPVVDSNKSVGLAILAYQDSRQKMQFKFIDRRSDHKRLPLDGHAKKQTFTQRTIAGIFTSLASKVQRARSENNVSLSSYEVITTCWWFTWFYASGAIAVSTTQCSSEVVFTPENLYFLTSAPTINENNGGGGGGGGGNPGMYATYANMEIIDSLQGYPCAQDILKQLPNINDKVKEILQEVFGVSADINIKFTTTTELPITTDGDTKCGGSINFYDCVVRLNSSVLNQAVKDYTVATMIHEALHAYISFERTRLDTTTFKAKYPIYWDFRGNDAQHNLMANKFLQMMADVITAFNPQISAFNARALAWGGLNKTGVWAQTTEDTSAIKQVNLAAKYPTNDTTFKFKKCP